MDDLFEMMMKTQEAAEQVFGGGGSGIIANTVISSGYKVFAKGATQDASWFPFVLGDADADKKAQTRATQYAQEVKAFQMYNGEPSSRLNVHFGFTILARKDGAMSGGQEAQWQGDRHFFSPAPKSWHSSEDPNACRDVVLPSLKENGIGKLPWSGWTRIGFKPDPYKVLQGDAGKTDIAQDGTARFPLVAYITAVFENETAAKAGATPVAAAPEVDTSKVGKPGPDWTWTDFLGAVDAIKEAHAGGQSVAAIATDYALDLTAVLYALDAHSIVGAPPMVAKRFGVSPADIAAVKELAKGLEQ